MITPDLFSEPTNTQKLYKYEPNYGIINYEGIQLVMSDRASNDPCLKQIIKEARHRLLSKYWPSSWLNVRFSFNKDWFVTMHKSANEEFDFDSSFEEWKTSMLNEQAYLIVTSNPDIKRNIEILTNIAITPSGKILIDMSEALMQCLIGFFHCKLTALIETFNDKPLLYSCKYTNNALKVMLPLLFAPWYTTRYNKELQTEYRFARATGIPMYSYESTNLYKLIDNVKYEIDHKSPFNFQFNNSHSLNPQICFSKDFYSDEKWSDLRDLLDIERIPR
ncbi:MAG: hypothetical protein ILO53_04540 [Clostridia bacterium]|nr:hypothetical protein [Clostridia bacterium]